MAFEDVATGRIELRLDPVSDIRTADDLKSAFLAALDGSGDVVVDAGEVERIDTATAQCLVALGNDLRARGRRLIVAEPSARFDQVMVLLGLDGVIR